MDSWLAWLPPWLKEWVRVYVVPFLQVELRHLLRRLLQGILDTFLIFTIPTAAVVGSEKLWESRYRLTPAQQETVARWVEVSDAVARLADVPPATPLVLWYKEGGLRAVNPDNCEGIMGLYTAVRSGRLPCFTPGPIGDAEVARQLRIGAAIFKEHCPEVHYTTTDPETLKRCYLYYNAGRNTRLDPDRSGYVMNGYDAAHQNMVHRTASGQVVRLQALGAWPAHLAIQTQLTHRSSFAIPSPLLPLIRTFWEGLDRLRVWASAAGSLSVRPLSYPSCVSPAVEDCFVASHEGGRSDLRPQIRVGVPVIRTGAATCGAFPGAAMEAKTGALLTAPMPGHLANYSDQWGNLTLQIENEEWTVWVFGVRSQVAAGGNVRAGQPLGTLKEVFYVAVYDRVSRGFVDPRQFLVQLTCPVVDPALQRNPSNQEDDMDLAALLPLVPLILGLIWAFWLLFKKDLLARGPVQVIVYFVGVVLALWIIGWMVDAFLPQWVAQRLVNARQSQQIRVIQQVSREILNEAAGGAVPTVVIYTPAPPVPAAIPVPSPVPIVTPTPIIIPPQETPISPQPTPPQGLLPVVPAQAAGEQVYVVRSGDTLYSIARRFGVTVAAIQQRNNLADPNDIKVGQQLIIPSP